jgi:signal transduction histidine kinase
MDAGRFVKVQTLRRAGFEVSEAGTGSDALKTVEKQRPDLVILDVNLPDISGLEVSRRLRLLDLPALQILQISNTAVTPADRVRGLDEGADVYLVEPVESDVLIATVNALLRVHRAEKALSVALANERRARQIAEEASRLKDDFIATLSHELRTPLNALMGWIWQLQHSTLTESARTRALDSLERNGRMQAQLINDLLDVSRISKGKLQLQMQLVNLGLVAQAACEVVRDAAAKKQIDFQVRVTPACVAGDRGRLQQIITNLLTNAVQFTPTGGRITLTVGGDDQNATLSVTDTGAGIDAAFLPYVFDPFRQGDGSPSRRHGGLGLGLAVVRQLVDLHGGDVVVASSGLGRGATFTVTLPRETVLTCPTDDAEADLLLKDVRIAICSDDEASRQAIQSTLEAAGAKVSVAPASGAFHIAAADADLVVTTGPQQRVGVRRPDLGETATEWGTYSVAQPADIVRRIAHMTQVKPA